mgnify:CR=1 FL=1
MVIYDNITPLIYHGEDEFMENLKDPSILVARILLVLVFVIMGYGKIGGYDGTIGYMESYGIAGMLLPLMLFAVGPGKYAINDK